MIDFPHILQILDNNNKKHENGTMTIKDVFLAGQ